jgi:endonuclease III
MQPIRSRALGDRLLIMRDLDPATLWMKRKVGDSSSAQIASRCRTVIRTLISRVPGRFSSELGLSLSSHSSRGLFLWFLAAILYGARISGAIVAKTHAEFVRRHLTSPKQIVKIGWDGLVEALDAGGYVRYDFKTATKLLEVMNHLLDQYGGNLQMVHDAAADARDLETRLKSLGKGIGDVTVQIFLRELRDIWPKAQPTLSPLSILATRDLALFPTQPGRQDRGTVDRLRILWKRSAVGSMNFCDFESALVRLGRDYCRRKRKQNCPMREFCA